ncbi:MAG: tetratricopeptide repeat protein [Candidatus Heimdallarchaeaceae archaeon]|jgi:tetratricopeptide (TPR) repeat protein
MKVKGTKRGFPREFAIYIPLMSEKEQELFKESENDYNTGDSLIIIRDFLVDLVPNISEPSEILMFALGKMLFNISDYDTLTSFDQQYSSEALNLWFLRLYLEKGLNEKVIKLASKIKEKENIPILLKLHSIRSIANGYLNLGNYEQCKLHLNMLFEEGLSSHKLSRKEKPALNDILLDGHKDDFFVSRYADEKIKLENKLNVAMHIALDLKERNHIGHLTYLLALLERDSGRIDDSQALTEEAIEIFEKTGNLSLLTASKGNLGTINIIHGDVKNAEKIFNEILQTFQNLEENKYVALTIKSLGDIEIERGNFQEATTKYEEALQIIEKLNMKETYQYCILAELYLQTNNMNEFESLIKSLEEEIRNNPSLTIESYILFLKGIFNIKNLNYGKAEQQLENALEKADFQGRSEISAKILMNLILLNISEYDVENDLEILRKALDNLDHILPFFNENQLLKEQIALYLLQGKIFAIKKDYTKSFNSLQQARELLQEEKNKQLLQIVEERIEEINQVIHQKLKKEIDWVNQPFRNDVSNLQDFGLRYMQKSPIEIDVSPLALIVLHRSGIPLRSYVILKKTVKDQLLFGGFIVAVKDMLTELFEEQKSQMLVITYGNHKIIIEAHPKGFSSVAVSAFDSFSLRRKIHQLTDKLSYLDIPKHFHGELDDDLAKTIDDEVKSLFGKTLIFSDAIKIDL